MPSRVDAVLERARARLVRLEARDVPHALSRGALLVDIRPAAQRAREGEVPAALVIERNVLEWRCDPTSDARLPEAAGDDVEWVILCSEGYTSSLANRARARSRTASTRLTISPLRACPSTRCGCGARCSVR